MNRYNSWKRSAAALTAAVGMALVLTGGTLRAQAPTGPDTSSSTTEDSTGKVTAISESTISVNTRRGPFTYRFGPDMHIIGPQNQRLKIGDVHAGQEATVYYYQRDGESTVARIVILKEADGKKGRDK